MWNKQEIATKAATQHRRLLAELESILEVRAWKRLSALGLAIGRGKNFVVNMLKGERSPRLLDLLKVLAAVDVELEELSGRAGNRFSVDAFLARLAKRRRSEVENVMRVLAHHPAAAWSRQLLRCKVDALEELRFTDREAAKQCAIEILRQRPPTRFQGEPLRVLGVIARAQGRYSAAAYYLRRALKLGRTHPRSGAHALLSVASLAGDQGNYRVGHAAVELAAAIYRQRVDAAGLGRTLVASGKLYGEQGKLKASRESFRQALALLAPEDALCRFSALQSLGRTEVFAGDLRSAKAHLAAARTVLRDQGLGNPRHDAPELAAWGLWLRGEIALQEGDLEGASRAFGKLHCRYLESSDGSNALEISLRVCKVLYRAGRPRELATFAGTMAVLLAPLERDNSRLAAAVRQLITAATAGRLTEIRLEACYQAAARAAAELPRSAPEGETPLGRALVSWREL